MFDDVLVHTSLSELIGLMMGAIALVGGILFYGIGSAVEAFRSWKRSRFM